jgi:hypothetical protein
VDTGGDLQSPVAQWWQVRPVASRPATSGYDPELTQASLQLAATAFYSLLLGRISWPRQVRLENPLGHGDFLSGLKWSGERDVGLG